MTKNTNKFVDEQTKQLPIKYLRKSISSLFNRDIAADDIDSLEAIQDQYSRYILTPVK